MVKFIMERMRELEQAIHASKNDPIRLKSICGKLQIVGQGIAETMEEIMNDQGIRQKEELEAYVLKYMVCAMLMHSKSKGSRAKATGARLGPVVTYKGNAIDLVELGLGIWLSGDILVDGKPAKQIFIKQALEKMFGVSLGHWYVRVQELKQRKKDSMSKNNEIIRRLSAYLEQV